MFVFKDKNSVDMGVYAKEHNFLGKAPLKNQVIVIEGRDGEEIIPLGYGNFISSLNDVVLMKNNRDDVVEWLNGKGTLEYLGKQTTIQFVDEYLIKQYNKPFSIAFTRDPFWYKANDNYVLVTTEVFNEGNTIAKPLIRLIKGLTNQVEIQVGGVQFEYDFKGESEVIIDCIEKEAKYDDLLRNRQLIIGFEFPQLQVGSNTVELLEGDATIEFKRKDVWL